ncbi:nucleoside triphosphate pyrophosphohydrolase family protein [Sphingobacterium tabacisoli]|uniref:NTP pyrophosphohydrolase MazG putative catalytic core domain-containing protein n=1 Tax=Sphingobacterium tabacisoli TaxID=2044855 RepID=A0ABW5L9S3_9SPHI|nr:hypothetical protein [Sphingobacterium tabacisoli]
MENKKIEMPHLNELCRAIFQQNKEKGFWNREINIGECLMLITGELGEALEADRKGRRVRFADFEETVEKAGYQLYEFAMDRHYKVLSQLFLDMVKDTLEDEIADAVIRLFDLAAALDIDLESHIWAKLMYNKGRAELHGKLY